MSRHNDILICLYFINIFVTRGIQCTHVYISYYAFLVLYFASPISVSAATHTLRIGGSGAESKTMPETRLRDPSIKSEQRSISLALFFSALLCLPSIKASLGILHNNILSYTRLNKLLSAITTVSRQSQTSE